MGFVDQRGRTSVHDLHANGRRHHHRRGRRGKPYLGRDLLERCNLALLTELIIYSALRRRPENRGLHSNLDHPDEGQRLPKHTIFGRNDGPAE